MNKPTHDTAKQGEHEHGEHGEQGKVGWALAWLIGIPLPLLLVVYLITRAC